MARPSLYKKEAKFVCDFPKRTGAKCGNKFKDQGSLNLHKYRHVIKFEAARLRKLEENKPEEVKIEKKEKIQAKVDDMVIIHLPCAVSVGGKHYGGKVKCTAAKAGTLMSIARRAMKAEFNLGVYKNGMRTPRGVRID